MQVKCECPCGKKAMYELPSGITNRGQITLPPAGTYPIKCVKCHQVFTIIASLLITTLKPKEPKQKKTEEVTQ